MNPPFLIDEYLKASPEIQKAAMKLVADKNIHIIDNDYVSMSWDRNLWNIAVDTAINETISKDMSEGKKFIDKLKAVCIRTLGDANVTGVPGGFASYAAFDDFIMYQANKLRRYKRDLKRMYTAELNRYLKGFEVGVRDRAEAGIAAVCEKLHIGFELCGDPRGDVVLLHLPSGETNDWGGTGWVVP